MRRMVVRFARPNQAGLSSVRQSRDSITTIFRWQHEFSGRTSATRRYPSGMANGVLSTKRRKTFSQIRDTLLS